jgi:O-antigen/teichoic acid export membrane protein
MAGGPSLHADDVVARESAAGPASAGVTRNASTSYALRAVVAISALVLTPYLYRRLGEAGFGTWSVLLTLTMISDLIEHGFSAGAAKLIAEARGRADRDEVRELIAVTSVLMGAMGIIALAFAGLLAVVAAGLAAPGERSAFQAGLIVLGVAALLRLICGGYGAALMGYQRWDLWNAAQGVKVVGYVVLAVVAIESGAGVFGLAVAFAVPLALGGVAQHALLRRIDPSMPLRPHRGAEGRLRDVGRFNGFVLLADSMVFIGQRLDTVFIAGIASAAAAAPYAAAVRLQSGVQSLTLPFLNLLLPMVSELDARRQTAEVVRRLVFATRLSLQMTLPVALAIALFAHDIVDAWLGADADDVAVPIIVALMAVQVFGLTAYASEKVLIGVGQVRTVGMLAVAEGITNVVASVTLISVLGAVGAAVGTLAVTVALSPLRFPLACRALGTPLLPAVRAATLPALQGVVPAAMVMIAIFLAMDPGLLRLGAGTILGLGLALLLGLLQAGPGRVSRFVRSRVRRRRASALEAR